MINFLTVLQTSYIIKRPIDDELISEIANGSMGALHDLYDSTYQSIYGFVLSITKNTHDAEDVLQETFLTVFQKASEYKPSGKPMAWIFTIAKNHALSRLRSKSKLHLVDEDEREIGITFADIENSEQKMVLEAAFKVLTDEEREILMLHAISGMKHREIAGILNLSLNTVLSKYHRATKKMKTELEREV